MKRCPEAISAFAESAKLAPWPGALIQMGKVYSRMGDNKKAASAMEQAAQMLDAQASKGPMQYNELDLWLKERRATAFWLSQAYARMGRPQESRKNAAYANRLSELTSEMRSLNNRAHASPPDEKARIRLAEIVQNQVALRK